MKFFIRWGVFLLVGFLLISVLEVIALKFINPRYTPMMGQRWLEAKLSASQPPLIRQQWLALKDVPPDFIRFVLIAEDQSFFSHQGFDWREIKASLKRNKKPLRGASTITMQCARTVCLWQGYSYIYIRKGLEIYYTILMEGILGKKRILELYVNLIEMGPGIYGIDAAAKTYYHVPPERLSRGQLALLAGILPNPLKWSPIRPSPTLLRRQQWILHQAKATP